MSNSRPPAGRPANRRRADRERSGGMLRLVPPLECRVTASPDAEQDALTLIEGARAEAAEQARLAAHHRERASHHAEQEIELLRLAAMTERVIWA